MATMLVTAIAAPQPTYSTSSTCQLIIRTRIPSHRCSPLLLCGFCPCVGYVGVVCVAYKNTSRPFRAADPAHVPEVLFAVEKDPRCYRVESCRVVSCRVELHVRWKSGISLFWSTTWSISVSIVSNSSQVSIGLLVSIGPLVSPGLFPGLLLVLNWFLLV